MPNDQYISLDPFIHTTTTLVQGEWDVNTYNKDLNINEANEFYTGRIGSYYSNAKGFQDSLYINGVFITEYKGDNHKMRTDYYVGTSEPNNLTVNQLSYLSIEQVYGNPLEWDLVNYNYILQNFNEYNQGTLYRQGDDVVTYLSATAGINATTDNFHIYSDFEHNSFLDHFTLDNYGNTLYMNIRNSLI